MRNLKQKNCNEFHYIYKITDPLTDEYYIGVRTSKNCIPEEDDYMGSYCSWKPENENRLQKEILSTYITRKLANSFERKFLIEKLKIEKDEKCMNAHIPGIGFCTYGDEEIGKKISNSLIGIALSNNHKQTIRKAHKGKKLSAEHKHKIGLSVSGKKHPMFGKTHDENARLKIKKARINWHRNNVDYIRGSNNPMWGVTGSLHPNSKKVQCLQENCCDNKIYDSTVECSKNHNLNRSTISYHCNGRIFNQKFKFIEQ